MRNRSAVPVLLSTVSMSFLRHGIDGTIIVFVPVNGCPGGITTDVPVHGMYVFHTWRNGAIARRGSPCI